MSDVAEKPNVADVDDIEYPTSDGKPMAESDKHRDLAYYVIAALKRHFADRPNVYVSGNNFIYWEKGNAQAVVSPDAYVVFGPAMRQRDCYKAWEEDGKLPDVVFEFTSRTTRKEDRTRKWPVYERILAVSEYFLFDPTGDYLKPRFQGYRLVEGRYVPLEVVDGRLYSERLGLELVVRGQELRLFDPVHREWILSYEEETERARIEAERARTEAERANQEARRAETAESEISRLRAELEALRRHAAG